jgi:hypothetical protein
MSRASRIFRYCSSVLSSSLTEASPSGHSERVVTASHASVANSSATACSVLRPNHRLAPARFYSDYSPPLRCLNHVVDRTTHRDRYFPATTEAPALVPELHPLVHVVGRFYPSDRSGVFRSPDLSQFPKGSALDSGSSYRSDANNRFRWALAVKQEPRGKRLLANPKSKGTAHRISPYEDRRLG